MEENLVRNVRTKYGTFRFEAVDYPGPSPLVDINFGATHLGWFAWFDFMDKTDLELLNIVNEIMDNNE